MNIPYEGSGKTYAASVLAEELLQAGQRFCAIDPTGVWWGLKASADGTGPGFPVGVLAAQHDDLPLSPEMGPALAELISGDTSESVCCLLDVSTLAREEQYRLVADFAEHLYARNRAPLMLLVDEADEFAPQVPERAQRRVLGAMDRLVRRGRVRGIGCTLVSQRPASLNKNVLSQTEILLALQLTSAQDRKAIEAWVSAQADSDQQQEMMATLAGLDVGEAWVWSPSWLRMLRRVHIRRRLTFDSSATPAVGHHRTDPVVLAAPDVPDRARQRERLERMLTTAKTAETANDPPLLKEHIAILQRQLRALQDRPEPVRHVERVVERRIEIPVLSPEQVEQLTAAVGELRVLGDHLVAVAEQVRSALDAYLPTGMVDVVGGARGRNGRNGRDERTGMGRRNERNGSRRHMLPDPALTMARGTVGVPAERATPGALAVDKPGEHVERWDGWESLERPDEDGHPVLTLRTSTGPQVQAAADAPTANDSPVLSPILSPTLSAPQQRILDALAAFEALGLTSVARSHVAVFSRQSPRSSGFGNNLGRLHTLQLIAYPQSGHVALTEAGRPVATHTVHITSLGELHAAWLAMLPNPQARILRVLLAEYPDSMERSALAAAASQSPTSSGFGNNLGALRSLGLIDYPQHGYVVATTLLFPEAGLIEFAASPRAVHHTARTVQAQPLQDPYVDRPLGREQAVLRMTTQ